MERGMPPLSIDPPISGQYGNRSFQTELSQEEGDVYRNKRYDIAGSLLLAGRQGEGELSERLSRSGGL